MQVPLSIKNKKISLKSSKNQEILNISKNIKYGKQVNVLNAYSNMMVLSIKNFFCSSCDGC